VCGVLMQKYLSFAWILAFEHDISAWFVFANFISACTLVFLYDAYICACVCILRLFFFFLPPCGIWNSRARDQISDPSCSCDPCHMYGNAGSLINCTWLGLNFHPRAPETPLILLHHSGNSCILFLSFFLSFFFFVLLGPHPRHLEVPRLGVEWEL